MKAVKLMGNVIRIMGQQ